MSTLDFIINKIKTGSKLLLMFDYDGTLTPIVMRPELAILNSQTKNNLEKIAAIDFIQVAIISGRSIEDLKKITGLNFDNITLYGIHGGEKLEGNKIFVDISPEKKKDIEKFKKSLENLAALPGIIIEDKGYSLSLHYRMADEATSKIALEEFRKKAETLNLLTEFRYQEGKKVLEILPKSFNKLKAVNALIDKYEGYLPVYFGDDKTDAYPLREVQEHGGLAVLVEAQEDYHSLLPDQSVTIEEIMNFLDEAVNLTG